MSARFPNGRLGQAELDGESSPPHQRVATSGGGWLGGGRAAAAAVLLVLAIDVLALASIVAARGEARAAAVAELAQQTRSQARAVEALLATLRADLAFLASSSLADSFERLGSEDPLSRRWARLDSEGTLLLFAEGHPALVALELSRADGSVAAAVTRLEGSDGGVSDPVAVVSAPPAPDDLLTLTVGFPGGGTLWAAADPARLLAAVVPSETTGETPQSVLSRAPLVADQDETRVRESIDVRGWQPEGPLVLERAAPDGPLLAAVERLTARWRTVVLLNLVVISLGLPLAVLAARAARSAARLAAEREHVERRRELEERLWRQERLATVGRLASNLAHEINNPLAGMTNHVALLEDELRSSDPAAAERRLVLVREGMERVRDIVQRTLRLASSGGGRDEPVDLVRVVEETVALICAGDSPSRVVRVHVGDDRGQLVVKGERGMLGQLLTNLLVNALDFGAGKPVDVHLRSESGAVTVVVEDRGPGIDPELYDRLFEPFVSGRGSTGLGLSVCLGIVREHGGTIVAANRAGGGARFTVRLPREGVATRLREREAS
ncbi:MAG: HAMP domain-containing sensor histidine kinase [Thermoanaerobaculia bacterium]|nr:HAMP domain-containing sensor histidine kinase [Thermoanaerobaculia bacterium]